MHNAPSVSYPAGRSRLAGGLLASAWLLGIAATALWWAQAPSPGWRLPAAWVALGATGAFAAWTWWRSPAGMLAWDGETWRWPTDPQAHAGAVGVRLDLQHSMLLRWSAGTASRWLWMDRASCPERWDDLRRAVYSRARPDAQHVAEPPAAKP